MRTGTQIAKCRDCGAAFHRKPYTNRQRCDLCQTVNETIKNTIKNARAKAKMDAK